MGERRTQRATPPGGSGPMTSPATSGGWGERHVGPEAAIRLLTAWSRCAGLDWDTEVLWKAGDGDAPAVMRVDLRAGDRPVGQGTGKGRGVAALASGMFEAFEDFALLDPWAAPTTPHLLAREALPEALAANAFIRALRTSGPPEVVTVEMTEVGSLLSPSPAPGVPVPAALVDFTWNSPTAHPIERLAAAYRSTNGVASGLSLLDALLRGLHEVNERDALGAFLVDGTTGTRHGQVVEPVGATASLLAAVAGDFATGVELRRLDSVYGHVVVAIATSPDSRGCAILGAGASWDLAHATDRAVLEVAQNLAVEERYLAAGDGVAASPRRIEPFPDPPATARLDRVPPPAGSVTVDGTAGSGPPRALSDQVVEAVEALAAAGLASYARPLRRTGPGGRLAPQVWQVFVPGCDRFQLVRPAFGAESVGRLRTPAAMAPLRRRWCA